MDSFAPNWFANVCGMSAPKRALEYARKQFFITSCVPEKFRRNFSKFLCKWILLLSIGLQMSTASLPQKEHSNTQEKKSA
jgi:hypothetical protein